MTRRRTFLVTAAGVSTGLLAGCGNPDAAPVRKLTIRDISTNDIDDGWKVTLKVINTHQAANELADFHEVEVLGYAHDQTLVCSKYLGTVTSEATKSNPISVKMTCSEFPTMLTFSAVESPCDEEVRTVLKIFTYNEEYGWHEARPARMCNEGLPPAPRGNTQDG